MNIQLSDKEAEDILKQHIVEPNRALLCEGIMRLIDSDYKKEILIRACMGLIKESKYKIGEKLLANVSHLSTYEANILAMEEKGLIVDGFMQVTLTLYDKWATSPYKVAYSVIHQDKNDLQARSYTLDSNSLKRGEIFPEYIAGTSPDVNVSEEDDLPF